MRFNLGTVVEGTEGLEAGLISLAPGVTLGSLLQFQVSDSCQNSIHAISDTGNRDVHGDEISNSLSGSRDEDSDAREASENSNDEDEVISGKRKTRFEAGKVSLELRGLGVKDGRAARQLASNDARPSRFGKRQKRSNS